MSDQDRRVTSVDQLRRLVGQEIGVGDWLEVTQQRVDAFADATGDHQWIHVDPELARTGPFGGTIAHGLLTLSISSLLFGDAEGVRIDLPVRMAVNYGYNRVRFPAPVRVGGRVRGRRRLLSVEEPQAGVIQQVHEVTVEIEGQPKPAMVAEHVMRLYL